MIKVRNVTKNFDGFTALDGLTLSVEPGSVYGLVGPNGAGKTTIMKILAGIYRADGGEITIDGENPCENPKIKNESLYISDDPYFFNSYTVKDMANLYAGVYTDWDWTRFEKMREVFGLDPVMRRSVWSLIMQDVSERGMTVLISSHNLRELEDVCDHVGIMSAGKIILEKSLDDVKGNIHKLQIAFKEGFPEELRSALDIMHDETFGSVNILIVRGDREEILRMAAAYSPLICEILPLTLEEVFIYEMDTDGYNVKDIMI